MRLIPDYAPGPATPVRKKESYPHVIDAALTPELKPETLFPPAGPDGDTVLTVDQTASPPLTELDPQHAAVLG